MHYVALLENATCRGSATWVKQLTFNLVWLTTMRGKSSHNSKYCPWRLVTYVAFSSRAKASALETYLKSGSGHTFAKKRLW